MTVHVNNIRTLEEAKVSEWRSTRLTLQVVTFGSNGLQMGGHSNIYLVFQNQSGNDLLLKCVFFDLKETDTLTITHEEDLAVFS